MVMLPLPQHVTGRFDFNKSESKVPSDSVPVVTETKATVVAADPSPPEPLPKMDQPDLAGEVQAKVDDAVEALRDRMQEMERVEAAEERLQDQGAPLPDPQAERELAQEARQEQQERKQDLREYIDKLSLPDNAKLWLMRNPSYVTDAAKSAQITKFHFIAEHESGETFTPKYFERLETHLGLRKPAPRPQPQRPVQAAPSYNVSAPISREVRSMRTGQPLNPTRRALTDAQKEIALACKPDPRMSDEKAYDLYRKNLDVMEQQKADGTIQDGNR